MAVGQLAAMGAQIGMTNAVGFASAKVTKDTLEPTAVAATAASGVLNQAGTYGKLDAAFKDTLADVSQARNRASQKSFC